MKRIQRRIMKTAILAIAGILMWAGCGKKIAESEIAYTSPIVDNVLSGITESNYAKFSRDFDETMKQSLTESDFPEILAKMEESLGEFKSKQYAGATRAKAKGTEYLIVKYNAVYEKSEKALITVYFTGTAEDVKIAGFMAAPAGGAK